MMGILAAIALPTWLQFLANQRVDAARDEIRSGIQQAQTNAIAQRRAWQLSLRDHGDRLAWAVHPSSVTPASVTAWQTLDPQIVLNEANTRTEMQDQVHSIQFNFRGEEQRRSIITLEAKDGAAQMHCVSVATLLGRTTDGKERAQPNPFGFECY